MDKKLTRWIMSLSMRPHLDNRKELDLDNKEEQKEEKHPYAAYRHRNF